MYLVAIAWMYVVLMMTVAEATSPSGTVLGATVTFVLYGVLPVSILMYLMGTPLRIKARRAAESAAETSEASVSGPLEPDQGGHAPGAPIAAKRKEI
jgi:uncharacterized membrane protein